MYIDGVILFGMLIIVLTCAVTIYLSYYSWKHMRMDALSHTSRVNHRKSKM